MNLATEMLISSESAKGYITLGYRASAAKEARRAAHTALKYRPQLRVIHECADPCNVGAVEDRDSCELVGCDACSRLVPVCHIGKILYGGSGCCVCRSESSACEVCHVPDLAALQVLSNRADKL